MSFTNYQKYLFKNYNYYMVRFMTYMHSGEHYTLLPIQQRVLICSHTKVDKPQTSDTIIVNQLSRNGTEPKRIFLSVVISMAPSKLIFVGMKILTFCYIFVICYAFSFKTFFCYLLCIFWPEMKILSFYYLLCYASCVLKRWMS